MVMFFKKKTVTLNIAVGQQFTTCDLQMNSWSWEEKDLFAPTSVIYYQKESIFLFLSFFLFDYTVLPVGS